MQKLNYLFFCLLGTQLVYGQFLSGNSDSSSSYPRIKLAGPLGHLIGGQGISLNSGLGQVLSSIINGASNGGASSGGPLSQLATAASSNYINAIRSLPFGQFGGNQQQQQHQHPHGPQFGGQSHLFNGMHNPMNFLSSDNGGYGQHHNFENGHFGPNSFPQFPAENYFGGQQYGGYNNHGPSSGPLSSSALYSGPGSYGGAVSGHNLDK